MKNTMRSALILLSMLVGFANGDDLEDFVNNLSTDLAPLLALFGERITMQFISQAVSFADCFALAMVPLGIITIMVSAIRVGGPTWLKAVVGRAKENRAVPELELMSSTSEEVCELYNGKHIVRCLGLGSIGQYTCLFRKGFLSSEAGAENWRIEFKTLREALQDGFLIQNEGPDLGGDVSITRRRKLEWIWTRFRQTVLASNSKHDDSLESGNIFSRHREPQEPDTQPTLIVIHDTEPEAPNIALNLQDTYAQTRIGVAAVFGLLVQSAVVGFFVYVHKGPEFQLKDGKPIPGYAFWTAVAGTISVALGILLCAHVVEKSTIEAFYRADDKFEMGVYWVQYRQRVNDQVFEPFVLSPSKTCSIISRSRRNKENGTVLSSKTVFGVLFGLSGTILQFVGLRGMNSMASLAQLIAIGIMTATRCIARPGFTSSFIKAKPRIGFELDWLAKRLTAVARNTTADPLIAPWLITMSREAQHQVLEPLTGRMRHQLPVSEAQSILVTRRGLSKLTPIPDNLRQKAGNLASALNVALNTLFPQGPRHGGGEGFRWFLNVRIRGQEQNQRVWIDLPFKEGRWSLEADDLVAVLSLWASVDPGEDEMSVEQAWEHVDPTEDRREPGMEPYLSEAYRNKEQVIQDMNTWAPQDHETLEAIRGISEGWGRASRSASFSGGHCEDVCATHLLFSFTWSMAMTLQDSLSGRTEPRRNAASNPDEQRSPLWNSQLARLAKAFAQVSARSEQAIILELIWSLSVAGKLPFPQPWFASMSATIMEGCRSGESKYFSKATTEAFYLIQTYAKGASGISERAAAWLLEQFHNMKDASERVGQSYGLEPAQLRARCEHLVDALTLNNATGDRLGPDFLGHMTELYRLQGREMDKMFCNTTSERLPTRFVTPLHRRAMIRGITTDDVPPEQRAIVNFRDVTNRTPLHCAAASGNAAVAKYLLNQHADIGLADSGGLTAAHHACLSGCGEILAMLIEKRAELKSQANNGASPMHLAAGEGHHDVVENLLKRKTPLGSPCKRDPEEELTKIALLRLRDFDGCMPVHWAAAGGHTQVLEPLKESIDAQGYRGWTPLHIAVMTGNGRLISALYRMSANGEIKDYSGRTPLVLACSERKWEVIQELVDAGAKLDAVDPQGRTALHYMADGDAITKLISILTESVDSTTAKDLANLQDQSGHTPLHLAAEHGNSAAVGQLLEAGAEANAINDREETPLFLGLRGAKTEEEAYRMAEALVGHGDRLEFESAEGESLIDVARRRNFAGVASYLEAERERREKENSTWTFDSWGDVRDVRCVCGERLAEWQLRQVDGEEAPGCHQCGLKPKEWQIRRDDGKEKCLDFWRDVRCVCGARLAEWQVRQVDGEEAAGCHQCGLKPKEWQL